MGYTAVSLAAAKTALAGRLNDPTMAFWTSAELGRLITDGLRTYQACTGFWRERVAFASAASTPFYDLATEAPDACGYHVLDRDVIVDIEDALQEPATPTAWTGSEQFTLADLTAAIERRRNQFLVETGMVVTSRVVDAVLPPATRTVLPGTVIDLRRVAWLNGDGTENILMREDEWAFALFKSRWANQAEQPPQAFSVSVVPPLMVQVAPAPLNTGRLRLLTVENGATLNPVAGVLLGVPDDWAWVVKFGALADLFAEDGIAADPARATYCQQRWTDGIALAKASTSLLLAGTINGQELPIMSVQDADRYSVGWLNVPGVPGQILVGGRNIFALAPMADAGPYGLTFDVLQNAPVNQDPVQVAPEALDAILGYAQHVGMLKLGGAEFAATSPLLDGFMNFCGVTLSRKRASEPNRDMLETSADRDAATQPRLQDVAS